jgi:hypothetical protein
MSKNGLSTVEKQAIPLIDGFERKRDLSPIYNTGNALP